jgi:hypothetical protein
MATLMVAVYRDLLNQGEDLRMRTPALAFFMTVSMAARAASDVLYAVDAELHLLYVIDTGTAERTVLGPLEFAGEGEGIIGGLTFDERTGLLYATEMRSDDLFTIDPVTLTTVRIGDTGVRLLHGLELDPRTGTLYATDTVEDANSNLYTIDPTTAAATLVGPLGFGDIGGLAYEPTERTLYGTYDGFLSQGSLVTIDVETGAATEIGPAHRLNSISFDSSGVLYGVNNGCCGPLALYTVDTTTGTCTEIGTIDAANILGIAFARQTRVPFIRGDANADAMLNISDCVVTMRGLFGLRPLPCLAAADVNDDGTFDTSDIIFLVYYLYLSGMAPPAPFAACGPDPTQDGLTCDEFPPCQ